MLLSGICPSDGVVARSGDLRTSYHRNYEGDGTSGARNDEGEEGPNRGTEEGIREGGSRDNNMEHDKRGNDEDATGGAARSGGTAGTKENATKPSGAVGSGADADESGEMGPKMSADEAARSVEPKDNSIGHPEAVGQEKNTADDVPAIEPRDDSVEHEEVAEDARDADDVEATKPIDHVVNMKNKTIHGDMVTTF